VIDPTRGATAALQSAGWFVKQYADKQDKARARADQEADNALARAFKQRELDKQTEQQVIENAYRDNKAGIEADKYTDQVAHNKKMEEIALMDAKTNSYKAAHKAPTTQERAVQLNTALSNVPLQTESESQKFNTLMANSLQKPLESTERTQKGSGQTLERVYDLEGIGEGFTKLVDGTQGKVLDRKAYKNRLTKEGVALGLTGQQLKNAVNAQLEVNAPITKVDNSKKIAQIDKDYSVQLNNLKEQYGIVGGNPDSNSMDKFVTGLMELGIDDNGVTAAIAKAKEGYATKDILTAAKWANEDKDGDIKSSFGIGRDINDGLDHFKIKPQSTTKFANVSKYKYATVLQDLLNKRNKSIAVLSTVDNSYNQKAMANALINSLIKDNRKKLN
jgi:hypothetical protein